MRTIINALIRGEPKPQPRPRAFKTKGGSVRVYDPATAEGWKSQIADAVRDQIPESPIDRPVKVFVEFAFRRPKSHIKKNGALSRSAPFYHITKPDIDNLLKALFDAFTDLGIWRDDKVVVRCEASKTYSDGPTIVRVNELDRWPTN